MNSPGPASMVHDAMEAHRLAGFSGADIHRLTRDGRHWFVRKSAATPSANARLKQQVEKQAAFAANVNLLRTPQILAEGMQDGKYYFDMEYVRGLDAISYLRRASFREVAQFSAQLTEYLRFAAVQPPLAVSSSPSFFDAVFGKLCDVQRATARIPPEQLARLFLALDKVRSLPRLVPTTCHGDLTLQNMLLGDDGSIWVVDLLDAPFEHYWQDIAKLHQDFSGGWYLLEQPRIAQSVIDYVSRELHETAVQLEPLYAGVHALLMACTFIRILPYAQTADQIRFVTERINYFSERTEV